jgi:hypothetical protein
MATGGDRYVLWRMRDWSPELASRSSALSAPLSLVVLAELWVFLWGRTPGELDLPGRPADRLILREQALHSRYSFASPPHRHTGVLVVPQLVHFCTYSTPPYKRWGSVAELTCHLQGSNLYGIRLSHKIYRPSLTKDVT